VTRFIGTDDLSFRSTERTLLPMPQHVTFDSAFFQEPQHLYQALRNDGPLHRFTSPTGVTGWMITDYDAARRVLNDRSVIKTQDTMAGADPSAQPRELSARLRSWLRERTSPWMVSHMLAAEPPDHTRLRGVVQSAFSPAALRALEPAIEQYATDLITKLDSESGSEPIDLVENYAFALPVQVICRILGVPERHMVAIGEASRVLSDVIVADPDDLRRAALTLAKIIYPLMRKRRRHPTDDVLSLLMQANRAKQLSLQEAMSTVALLLIAGHETTVNLIANTTHLLLKDRTALMRLQAGDSRLRDVIEESLRFEPPLPTTTLRQASVDLDIDGILISAGDIVMISLAAANRDPAKFDQPDKFDPARATRGSLAFGHGIHHCIGAPLARLEAEIALKKLLAAYPDMHLDTDVGDAVWRESIVFRGLRSLPVRLH
jgi:cytochrome P450